MSRLIDAAQYAATALAVDPTIHLCGSCVVWKPDGSGKVLMVSRKEDRTKFCLPGGKVDPDDWGGHHNPEEASLFGAIRELREETGFLTAPHHMQRIFGTSNYADGRIHHRFVTLYLVSRWDGELGTQEAIDVKWDYPSVVEEGPFGDLYMVLFDLMKVQVGRRAITPT